MCYNCVWQIYFHKCETPVTHKARVLFESLCQKISKCCELSTRNPSFPNQNKLFRENNSVANKRTETYAFRNTTTIFLNFQNIYQNNTRQSKKVEQVKKNC